MKNFYPLKQSVIIIICIAITSIIMLPGCKTKELKEQVATLSVKQILLEAERDSLQYLLQVKTREFDTIYSDYNSLNIDFKTLKAKNNTLQAGYNARGEQLKVTDLTNKQLNSSVALQNNTNDSLVKEIVTLQQRIAMIDAMIAESAKSNSELADMLNSREAERIRDSIAIANRPKVSPLLSTSGFISITEVGGALGLGDVTVDYSRTRLSLSTIAGYRITTHFLTGIGMGASVYNGGTLIPLYLDLRYVLNDGKISPFLVADGGMLFNPKDFNSSGLFINGSVGVGRKLNDKVSFHVSTGLLLQQAPVGTRTSFINFKGGVSFRGK